LRATATPIATRISNTSNFFTAVSLSTGAPWMLVSLIDRRWR